MEAKSNIEKLKDFARKTNREIDYLEEQYPLPSYRKIPKYKRWVVMPYDSSRQLFLVLFSDFYQKIGEHTIFCGIYFKTNMSKDAQLNFRPKNILDKLNPFGSKDTIKSDSRFFDSKVVISGNGESVINRYFKHSVLQRLMIESMDSKHFLTFSINETNVDFVPELAGESHFALLDSQEWVLDEQTIESWFQKMKQIKAIFDKKEEV
ncbi:hypothetical protein J1N10_06215 [Carboxylicivirga sp. A043]|uniref:hypothetical protein n=1 Tax=Carboxylicivirga litoralis TaxID=2816963 RepID=UPI0021CB453C|nr:hypothetical protein [Carboxylicivirga sp. A043]MCU4155563.1 hypothetical protein [Carboxylicivirga sp. A043]